MARRDMDPYGNSSRPDNRAWSAEIPQGATAIQVLEVTRAVSVTLGSRLGGYGGPNNYCYFLRAGSDGPVKIGSAADPWERMRTLQTGNHLEMSMLAIVVDDYHNVRLERELQLALSEYRMVREWFATTTEVMDVIRWLQERAR